MKHDYKEALEDFVRIGSIYSKETDNAICHALKIADKLMGEPSNQMLVEGLMTEESFEYMREQMLKEIG